MERSAGRDQELEEEALCLLPELWKVNPRRLFLREEFCLRAFYYSIAARRVLGEAFDFQEEIGSFIIYDKK